MNRNYYPNRIVKVRRKKGPDKIERDHDIPREEELDELCEKVNKLVKEMEKRPRRTVPHLQLEKHLPRNSRGNRSNPH
eukprot:705353-Amphidinium_carterae.1